MKKLYRSTLFAGVLAFGVVACGDDVSVVDPGDTPHPPLTVQLSGVSLNVGESANLAAQISGGNPEASTNWTCESSNTDIVTVSESSTGCLVTAQGMGNTTVTVTVTRGSLTGSASAQVTVAQLTQAQVSIHDIRQGGATANIDSISGQLDVVINVEPGDETPVQLDLLVDEDVVASQQFSQAQIAELQAAAEAAEASEAPVQITLSFNTGYYEIVEDEEGVYVAEIRTYNGPRAISANLHVAQLEAAPRASNTVHVTFRNTDGYHVLGQRQANSALDENGRRWHGGPHPETGEADATQITAIPVFYTGLEPAQVTVQFCAPAPNNTQSSDTAPYSFSFPCANYETADPTDPDAPSISGQYLEDGDDTPTGILNQDHPFPVRVDNLAPRGVEETVVFSIVRQSGLDNVANWLNDQYSFSSGFRYGNVFDDGVGKQDQGDEGYQIRTGSDEVIAPTPGLTGADIAAELGEDAESVTNTEYNARVRVCDRLNNCRFFAQESFGPYHPATTFGYDETAPSLTFETDEMGAFAEDWAIVDLLTGDDNISLVGTDVASGFELDEGLAFQRALTAVGSAFDAPQTPTRTVFGVGGSPVAQPFTTLAAGGIVSTLRSLEHTAGLGDEGFALEAQTTIEYSWSLGDYIQTEQDAETPRYYIYQVRIRDRAGNTTLGQRSVYHNNTVRPAIEALTRSGSFPDDPAFRVTFAQDPLELFEGSMALEYPNTGGVVVWERPSADISSVLRLDAGIEDGVPFTDYIKRPHRDLMLDLGFAGLGLPFIKNIQATDGAGATVATGIDDSKPVGAEAQVYNGLALELTDIAHGTTENGQSDLVGVGIPAEEVPDHTVDFHEDTQIDNWYIVEGSAPNCGANYCARLTGPTATFSLPFERTGVLIVWADATAPDVWRVLEVATPNFSGQFPTRDDGAERLYEWEFTGAVEGSAGGDIIFRAVGVNSNGDALLSSELLEAAPIAAEYRINETVSPDSAATVNITAPGSEDFTVTLETSTDGGATWTAVDGEDVTFSSSGLNGNFDESPPVVSSDVNGDATITFFGNGASTGTISATWRGHTVTWDVEIDTL